MAVSAHVISNVILLVVTSKVMNLEELNSAEQTLLSRVESATGLMEEKHLQLQQNGVHAEYRKIYEAYVEMITSETEWLEALKRSVFLLWYEQAEPSCFSGLFELPETAHQKVFNSLERRAEAGDLDLELKWMLPYYDMIAEWVFEQRKGLQNLQVFLTDNRVDNRELWLQELKAENFVGRGQMGDYWTSIATSNAVSFNQNAI